MKRFCSQNPTVEAVALGKNVFRDTTIVVQRAADDDWYALRAKAKQLNHEVVHAMQDILYPRMTEEEAEREAYYYQMLTLTTINEHIENPEFLYYLVGTTIENCIRASVETNNKIN